MGADSWQTLEAWGVGALVYPGLLFGMALALVGEWLYVALRPSFTPRLYRTRAHSHALFGPLYAFLKLLGRVQPENPGFGPGEVRPSPGSLLISNLMLVAGPVLALALMPLPGSPVQAQIGPAGDLLLVIVLLALAPVSLAAVRSVAGGLAIMRGGREIGRLATGLFPTLIALAALVQTQGGTTQMSVLTAAPETGLQFFVRLLAGVALLISLPWWSPAEMPHQDASAVLGTHLQRAALAAFWAATVLPAPGDPVWAVVVYVGGALASYIAMRALAERWQAAVRPDDAARQVWLTSLPVAALAVLAAFWLGG